MSMKLVRSLAPIGALLAALTLASAVQAQTAAWPSRPIRVLVPVPPGGAVDATARLLQDPLSRALGQPIVVENRPGGAGLIAAEAVARSPADGYTFGYVYSPHAANVALVPRLPFDPANDFTPIAFVWRASSVIAVHPSAQATTLAELVARSRAVAGGLSYGTPGNGSSMHIAGELLRLRSGAAFVHIPYRGAGPALNDVLGGTIPVVVSNVQSGAPHVQAGRLRGIAVTGPARSTLLPDVPTVAELGFPGFAVTEWMMLLAPAGLPRAIAARMNAAFNEAILAPDLAARLNGQGLETRAMSLDETTAFLADQIRALPEIVRSAGIKAD